MGVGNMTTHPETIQVPDGWTIRTVLSSTWAGHMTEGAMQLILARLPTEPPIMPCAYCGRALIACKGDDGMYHIAHATERCGVAFLERYTDRAEAIKAINRRAT
jgi:hypothetical protein